MTNPYSVKNVNVKQGTGLKGNPDSRPGKRSQFVASKEERAPLAKYIEDAYAARQTNNIEKGEREFTKQGSIEENVKPRKFGKDKGSIQKR